MNTEFWITLEATLKCIAVELGLCVAIAISILYLLSAESSGKEE